MEYDSSRSEMNAQRQSDNADQQNPPANSRSAGEIVLAPDTENIVYLPEGASLDDIVVRGRDLVIEMADGRVFVIPDGAVFIPQIVVNDVAVPPLNLAALLTGNEPQPAAGGTSSSGGNFADPTDPIQDAYGLGDLLPYTELFFPQPEEREILPYLDEEDPVAGEVLIGLDDDALAGNPGGEGDDPDGSNTSGFLPGSEGSGNFIFDLLNTGAPEGFTYVDGPDGALLVQQGGVTVLTIALDVETGSYTVTQNNPILHADGSEENNLIFVIQYTVTDDAGGSATGSITINVDDDTPTVDIATSGEGEVVLETYDAQTIGAASDSDATTADFSGVFGFTSDPGADGLGSVSDISYALSLQVAEGTASGLTIGGAAIRLYVDASGKVIGSTALTEAGVTTGNTVFTLAVDADGVVTLTQLQQIDHPAAGDPDGTDAPFDDHTIALGTGLVELTGTATITDKDGDTATDDASVDLGGNVLFHDDGPSITGTNTPVLLDDEAATSTYGNPNLGGVGDLHPNPANPVTGGNLLHTYGADGAGTVLLTGAGYAAMGTVDPTVPGNNLTFSQVVSADGLTLTIYQVQKGAQVAVLKVTLSDDENGNYTVEQLKPIFTSTNSSTEEEASFTINYQVTDGDGDTADGTLSISVDDDTPVTFNPDESYILNAAGKTATVSLNFAQAAGADGVGTVLFDIAPGTNANTAVQALDSEGNPLTYNSSQIYLFGDGTGLLIASTNQNFNWASYNPATPDASVIFTVALNAAGDAVVTVLKAEVSNGIGFSETDIVGAVGGGNNDSLTIGLNNNNNAVDIVIDTPTPGGTVNTSQGRIGLSGGNSISDGEIVTLDFAKNVDATNDPGDINLGTADPELAGLYATAWFDTTTFQQTVNRINGSNTTAGIAVEARYHGVSGPDIIRVVITDANGVVMLDRNTDGAGLSGTSVDFLADGTVSIQGIKQGWDYYVETATAMTGVEVTGDFNGAKDQPFTLGAFTLGGQPFEPFTLHTNIVATDGDGDSVNGSMDLNFLPNDGNNFVGTTGNETGPTALNGDADANIIAGLGGNDTISGGGGNDTLIGGAGTDTLTGGAGNDKFVMDTSSLAAGGADIITDYGAGDKIDLTQIINQTGPGSFVRYNSATGVVQVNTDGAGTDWVTVATLTIKPGSVDVLINVNGVATPLNVASSSFPIALDLDGDGVEFVGAAGGATYDYGNDGTREGTAWVAADDGLLAHSTADGVDIVFADDAAGAQSDLEGLRMAYDSNGDSQLTSTDTAWASFGVWQDADGDGQVDNGEFHSLTEIGITSISLASDDSGYTAVNGEVTVYGSSSFTMGDKTYTLADAAFSTTASDKIEARTAELTAISIGAAGLLALGDESGITLSPAAAELIASTLAGDDLPSELLAPASDEPEQQMVQAELLGDAGQTEGNPIPDNADGSYDQAEPALALQTLDDGDSFGDNSRIGDTETAFETEGPDWQSDPVDMSLAMTAVGSTMPAQTDGETGLAAAPQIAEAFGDSSAEDAINQLVAHFTGNMAAGDGHPVAPAEGALLALLGSSVSGGDWQTVVVDTQSADEMIALAASQA